MRYCQRCITPYNRPSIAFDAEGRCNCATAEDKAQIDWAARERDLRRVVEHARAQSRRHDCIIPASGGKDSTWQVVRCLEYGLNPLAVTWRAPGRTPLGQRNLENLIALGVDHIDYTIDPKVERRFTLLAFERLGIPALPMHMAIFAIPLRLAIGLGIPLVVWGENSAFEYGGEAAVRLGFHMDAAWLTRHGVMAGTSAFDWIGPELSERDLAPYFAPTEGELAAAGVRGIFLGAYLRWDPVETFAVAAAHGFARRQEGARTGHYDYADIDDAFISVHHWLKWYKFGFTRTFDNLSLEIRNGRMTRDAAIELLRRRGDETPHEDITAFCAWLGISNERFFAIAERFRNPDVWKRDGTRWVIPDFLVPDWRW